MNESFHLRFRENALVRKGRRIFVRPSFRWLALAIIPLSFWTALLGSERTSPVATQKESVIRNIGLEEFERLRDGKKAITLDVRTVDEYARGHLPGAINIDCGSRDFGEKIAALDKGQTYLIHCASGGRSAKACARMLKLNFTNVYNFEGGFKAWEQAGKPVEKTKESERTDR